MKVGLACRLSDDQHHHRLLLVGNPAVGQFYLLLLFVVAETNHATRIGNVRPRLNQSAQFRVVLRDKQRLPDIQRSHQQRNRQRAATVYSHLLSLTVHYWLQQTEQGRQQAEAHDEEPQRPAEESRSLRVAGIKHVLDGRRIYHHAIGHDEIDCRRIDQREDSQQHAPHPPRQEHHQVGHHEVQRQHHHYQRHQQEYLSSRPLIGLLSHIVKERQVVQQQRPYADNTRKSEQRTTFKLEKTHILSTSFLLFYSSQQR